MKQGLQAERREKMEKNIYEQPSRLKDVKMSPIRKMMDEEARVRSEGKDVVSFCVGEPDFDTPELIKQATVDALNANKTHYCSNRGILSLRQAIADKIQKETGISYNPETEILITSSGAEAINNALLGIIDDGDEVILTTPSFVNYESLIFLCKGIPVYLPLKEKNGFQIDEEEFESRISPKTKLLVINNPCNPTGAVFNKESMNIIAKLAVKYDLAVFSDEIYANLIYDGISFHSIAEYPGMRKRTIMMNGFSKTYAMTGWRVGYMAMDERFMKNILRVHQFSTTTGVTFIQWALAKTMNDERVMNDVRNMVAHFQKRRNMVTEALDQMKNISYVKPEGAFYVLINIGKTGMNGQVFCERLLHEKYVAAVPAIAFGKEYEDFVRISFAAKDEDIVCGMNRIREFIEENSR